MFFKNDDADTEIATFICAVRHFLTPDNCLRYMDAPQKPAIYLQCTTLVCTILQFSVVNEWCNFTKLSDYLMQ